jgi:hypothetical protein
MHIYLVGAYVLHVRTFSGMHARRMQCAAAVTHNDRDEILGDRSIVQGC